ncbi:hypothetical protein HIM_01953 [Hirsutella minnesotensis 3608]|nr:hypothetical protein HIM_01953 [Hirsutella minnesotensis 3608]
MARLQLFVLILSALMALASASAPTFCKCTCFKNSTIIPLGPASQHKGSRSSPSLLLLRSVSSALAGSASPEEPLVGRSSSDRHDRRSASTSCSECTKAFCLSQGIDFCKDAKEENVVTMCFQRDSNKDKFIVWGFILGTVGLLSWAAFKRVAEWREHRAMERQGIGYSPVRGTR